jgi:hypothetical protein
MPEPIPADLMRAAERAAYESLKEDHREPPALWHALIRYAVAAVLPLHEQQVRAAIDREVTDHAQREPMSSERLAQIRHDLGPGIGYVLDMSSTSHLRVACELLDEVERARAEVVVAWEFCDATQAALNAEFERSCKFRADLKELRGQLGEARLEWGVRIFDHDPANAVEVMSDETQAREVAACWRDEIDGSNPTLMQRTMRSEGQWRAG